ncbi:hypothetical protein E1100_25725 [Vibrio owensii]|uniref:hypothetical protein n=1 Tax=Vibrio owensii TaxID=696485 RepID=UPI00104A738F|nr:hypothetical protein [Vibrio owensii]TDE19262.1 hypothetical protein E1100_25725 [Vibrio owensii]
MSTELMAQDKEERKKAIAKARKAHHESMTAERKRVDAYVTSDTKQGLKDIKALVSDVRNEGQAIDEAVRIAMEHLKKPTR